MIPTRHPLQWPEGWPRLPSYKRTFGRFSRNGKDLTVFDAVQRVLLELERLGVQPDDVVISTNLRTRLDGLPRSDQSAPADPGCAVYWQKSAKAPMRCMAVDRYSDVASNLAAIAATLDAMRAIERHGGAAILDRAFTGFTALPAPGAEADWWTVLGVPPDATREAIEQAYRRAASAHHPDKGGNADAMARVNRARERGLAE